MTIEQLEIIRNHCIKLQDLRDQISQAYNTYSSPAWDRTGSSSFTAGSPVEKALHRKEKLTDLYYQEFSKCLEQLEEVEHELSASDDHKLNALIRCYYLNCRSWKEAAEALGMTASASRIYVKRKLSGC